MRLLEWFTRKTEKKILPPEKLNEHITELDIEIAAVREERKTLEHYLSQIQKCPVSFIYDIAELRAKETKLLSKKDLLIEKLMRYTV